MDDVEDVSWSSEEWTQLSETEIIDQKKTKRQSGLIASANKIKEKYGIRRKKRKSSEYMLKRHIVKVQESIDSDFSSNDNIPLKVLAQSLKENAKNESCCDDQKDDSDIGDVESCLDSGDSYRPNKKDINSSDSEYSPAEKSDSDLELIQRKPPKVQKLAKTNRMEKNSLHKAAMISLKESLVTNKLRKDNEKRLDILLEANGLQRQSINGDGNCFFQAATLHLDANSTELRKHLCDFMMDNVNLYKNFFSSDSTESCSAEEDLFYIDYSTEISKLREDGCWSTNSGDLLPKVLSEWSGRNVRIFSSSPHHPVIEISPVTPNTSEKDPICLAYISSDGIPEHYDGCVSRITVETETNQRLSTAGLSAAMQEDEEQSAPTQMATGSKTNNMTPLESEASTVINENEGQERQNTPPVTPRKVGRPRGSGKVKGTNVITPVKKKLVRRKKATPENWKKNVRKQLRARGQEYISQRGKKVEERNIKSIDCSKCKHKCAEKIDETERAAIFNAFWSLGSYERQKDFIVSKVQQKQTRTYLDSDGQPVKKSKNYYRVYTFTVDDSSIAVCKTFFLNTLGIGQAFVNHALHNQSGGVFVGGDKRGRYKPYNKTKEKAMDLVRKHIESFPAVEGHYTRKDSQRKYLGSDLNITKMYHLYLEKYKDQVREDELVSQAIYRRTFNEEYNFSFHLPKKDQCNICVHYHRAKINGELTEDMKENFQQHQQNKIRAREEKQQDKERAKECDSMFVCTFDLQAVLTTPCSLVNQMYYNRKLSCYNLSIFNLCNKSATCHVWPEVEAKRGSCEIATCLYLHLLSLPSNIKHAVFYSDNCAGQNRNQFIATSLMHAVTFLPNIEMIDHKFLEQGHTQMECDSIHSAIEFAKKKTEVFVPNEWATIIRVARRKNPYLVVPLKHTDIWDFKSVQAQSMKYSKAEPNGLKINWTKMKWLRFQQEDPDVIYFKYRLDEEFRRMKVSATGKRGRPGERTKELPRLYSKQLPISPAKKKDLVYLCSSNIIPREYHEYFKSLPSSSNTKDKLSDPDIEEYDEDSELE